MSEFRASCLFVLINPRCLRLQQSVCLCECVCIRAHRLNWQCSSDDLHVLSTKQPVSMYKQSVCQRKWMAHSQDETNSHCISDHTLHHIMFPKGFLQLCIVYQTYCVTVHCCMHAVYYVQFSGYIVIFFLRLTTNAWTTPIDFSELSSVTTCNQGMPLNCMVFYLQAHQSRILQIHFFLRRIPT